MSSSNWSQRPLSSCPTIRFSDFHGAEAGAVRELSDRLYELDRVVRQFEYAVALCETARRHADDAVRAFRANSDGVTQKETYERYAAWLRIGANEAVLQIQRFRATTTATARLLQDCPSLRPVVSDARLKIVSTLFNAAFERIERFAAAADTEMVTVQIDRSTLDKLTSFRDRYWDIYRAAERASLETASKR